MRLHTRLALAAHGTVLLDDGTEMAAGTLVWAAGATSDRGHTVRIAPFHGVTGIAWDEPGEHSTIPPRPVGGGNIDCKELVAGSILYLPVAVPGALLSIGDGHAAQGDGEVAGTAIECGMTTELQLDLVTERPVPEVHAETPAGQITFGFSPDLNAAMGDALDAMLTWLQASYGVGNGAGVGQPGARPEGHAGGEPVLGRSCAASGGRDQLTGGVVRRGTASAPTATAPSEPTREHALGFGCNRPRHRGLTLAQTVHFLGDIIRKT